MTKLALGAFEESILSVVLFPEYPLGGTNLDIDGKLLRHHIE